MIWDVLATVERRRNGLVDLDQFRRSLSRLLGSKLRPSGVRRFERMCRVRDADVFRDRLLVVGDSELVVFDVSHSAGDQEKLYKRLDESRLPACPMGWNGPQSQSCVRWSPEGCLFSASGTSLDRNALSIYDLATMSRLEVFDLAPHGSEFAYTHEHCPTNPALVGIGSSLKQILIADLRSGSVVTTGGSWLTGGCGHTGPIVSLCWSLDDETVIVSAGRGGIFVWDRRYLTNSSIQQLNFTNEFPVAPDMKFLDHRRLITMESHTRLVLQNVRFGSTDSVLDIPLYRGRLFRYKLAVNREASIVYFPVRRHVKGYDFLAERVVMEKTSSHIFPVELLYFNDRTREMYTLNHHHEGIVWSPFQ